MAAKTKEIDNFDQYRAFTFDAVEQFNRSDYEGALAKFQEMAAYNPENRKIHETLSIIYLKLERLDDAQREFNTALELANRSTAVPLKLPTFETFVASLEDIEVLEKRYFQSEASETKTSAPEKAETSSRLPIHLGISYMARGDYQKAEKLLLDYKEKKIKQVRERGKNVTVL